MTHIFIDTNVFLHFTSFTEIDWTEIIEDESFNIIIPLVVISELDKKKTHHSKKIADKAKSTLEKFNKVIEGEKLGRLDIILLNDRPKKETYEVNELSSEEPDDRIIASIIEHQTSGKKILISNDTAIRIRAKHFGIDYKIIPAKYALTDSTDEEKEIKDLKNQLKQAKEKTTKLKLNFTNGSNIVNFQKKQLDESITEEDFIARESYKIKLKPLDLNDPFIDIEPNGLASARKYNNDLNDYKADSVKYFRDSYYFALYSIKTYELFLTIDNKEGSIPAEKVEIKLDFPNDIKADSKFLATPELPDLPKITSNLFTLYSPPGRRKYYDLNYSQIFNSDKRNSVIFNCPDIKHHKQIDLDPIYITFMESVHSFNISYVILADNMGQKIEGTLNIIID